MDRAYLGQLSRSQKDRVVWFGFQTRQYRTGDQCQYVGSVLANLRKPKVLSGMTDLLCPAQAQCNMLPEFNRHKNHSGFSFEPQHDCS